jgi:hypothetical protein
MKHEKKHCQFFRFDEMQAQGKTTREFWQKHIITTKNSWCASTMKIFGPDKYPVTVNRCVPGRSCFKPLES